MARNLPFSTLRNFCSPEWIAKTYSEYMYDCASAMSELIEAITSVGDDDSLTAAIEAVDDVWAENYEAIQDVVLSTFDPSEQLLHHEFSDQRMRTRFNRIINGLDFPDEAAQIAAKISNLNDVNDDFRLAFASSPSILTLLDFGSNNKFIRTSNSVSILIEGQVNKFFTDYSYNRASKFSLDEGFVSYEDLVRSMVLNINGLDEGSFFLPLENAEGTVIDPAIINSYTSESIFEQMKSSFASAIAWGAGYAAIVKNTVADRVSYFSAQIKSMISDSTAKFANTVNVVQAMISETYSSITDFFSATAEVLGWNDVRDELFTEVDKTDVYAYTGASPLSSVTCAGAQKVLVATGKTALAIGFAIFNAAKSLCTKVWRKVKPFIRALTDNPVDIGVVDNKDDSYACSNFRAQVTNHRFDMWNIQSEVCDTFISSLSSKLNQWIALETYFGEVVFRITKIDKVGGTPSNYDLHFTYDIQFRPRCLNYQLAIDLGLITKQLNNNVVSLNVLNSGNIDSWLLFLDNDYRPDDDEDEEKLYMGFWMADMLMYQLSRYSAYELLDWFNNEYGLSISDSIQTYTNTGFGTFSFTDSPSAMNYYCNGQGIYVPPVITNLDFVKVTSGFVQWQGGGYGLEHFPHYVYAPGSTTNNSFITLDMAIVGFMFMFVLQQYDKHMNPTEYLFLPYTNNTYNFSQGRYKIKTDAENADVANIIATALILVVVVVISILVVKKIVKIHKVKKIARLNQKKGVLDQKMWNGEKLTYAEARRYTRCANKLSKLESASSGLAGSDSIGQKIFGAVKSLQSGQTSQVSQRLDSASSPQSNSVAALSNDNATIKVDLADLRSLIKG